MRPHGKYARVDATNPEAFAQCDRCGFWYNRTALRWQAAWAGQHIYNIQVLVCGRCLDIPNEQLRTIVLPPDPPPIINARPPDFTYEEDGPIQTTLTANAAQGALTLPVNSTEGFEAGQLIWVQLDNATYAQMRVDVVDTENSLLSITEPLPFSAPTTGSVTVSIVER